MGFGAPKADLHEFLADDLRVGEEEHDRKILQPRGLQTPACGFNVQGLGFRIWGVWALGFKF